MEESKKLTGEELCDILYSYNRDAIHYGENGGFIPSDYYKPEVVNDRWDLEEEWLLHIGVGPYKEVVSERYNEYYTHVIHFTDHDVYLEITGNYTSHVGTEYYESAFNIVRPRQVTITVYD